MKASNTILNYKTKITVINEKIVGESIFVWNCQCGLYGNLHMRP